MQNPNFVRMSSFGLAVFFFTLGVSPPIANSMPITSSLTIDELGSGSYDRPGEHRTDFKVAITGQNNSKNFRSYFLFDLSALSSTVTSATLLLDFGGHFTNDNTESLTIRDVSAANTSVIDDPFPDLSPEGRAIYIDLGTGNTYGNFTVDTLPDHFVRIPSGEQLIDIVLNVQAIADINAQSGGLFAVGLTLDEISRPFNFSSELVQFGTFGVPGQHQLKLALENDTISVPLPASVWLFLTGLVGLGLVGLKRRGVGGRL